MPYRRVKPDAPRDRWGHVSGDPHHNFLRSRQWQKIRAAFLSAHPLCEHCGLLGRTTAATTADHIERLVDSDHFKRTSWAGLQALCAEHHNAKSNWERISPAGALPRHRQRRLQHRAQARLHRDACTHSLHRPTRHPPASLTETPDRAGGEDISKPRPTSVIGGKADMARTCRYVR